MSLMWSFRIFTEASVGLILLLHILLGLVLASWSLFIAVPFGNTPQLAAVVTTFLGVILTIIGLAIDTSTTWFMVSFSILFPPSFYIFALKAICGYENHSLPADLLRGDPDRNIQILPLLLATVVRIFQTKNSSYSSLTSLKINIFLWPFLAILFERYLYDVHTVNHFKHNLPTQPIPKDTAISIRNLTKVYKSPGFTSKGDVTAVSNLSLDIPKNGIFVMLGSNGFVRFSTSRLSF